MCLQSTTVDSQCKFAYYGERNDISISVFVNRNGYC